MTAQAGGGSPDRVGGGGVFRPVAGGQKFMCCVRNPRNINVFVRVPGREDSGSRPGGSVTGVTEKLFMCQMFMCLFRPLSQRARGLKKFDRGLRDWKFRAIDRGLKFSIEPFSVHYEGPVNGNSGIETFDRDWKFRAGLKIRSQEKGDFRRVFFCKMYASLGCGALTAKCIAGANILGYFLFSWRWHWTLQKPPLLKPPFLGFWVKISSRDWNFRSYFLSVFFLFALLFFVVVPSCVCTWETLTQLGLP